jgi:protein O-GlcNAc transferase
VGLEDFVAHMPGDYVETAIRVASDPARLAELRPSLRGRMNESPLCDGPGQTRKLEQAYRAMWAAWLASRRG